MLLQRHHAWNLEARHNGAGRARSLPRIERQMAREKLSNQPEIGAQKPMKYVKTNSEGGPRSDEIIHGIEAERHEVYW